MVSNCIFDQKRVAWFLSGLSDPDVDGFTHFENVVLKLMSQSLNAGHLISINNFCTNVELYQELVEVKIYCTGNLHLLENISQKRYFEEVA